MARRIWSADEVLDEYRRLTRELGTFPSPQEFERRAAMSYGTLRNKVGSTPAVQEAMGVRAGERWDAAWLSEEWGRARVATAERSSDLRERREPWDVAWVFEHDWADAPRKVLSCRVCPTLVRTRCSAIAGRNGRRRARRQTHATRAELLAAMQRLRAQCGDFDQKEFEAAAGIPAGDIYREFPSWAELRRAAGFATARRRMGPRIPDGAILDAWAALQQKLGRAPSLQELGRETPFSVSTYVKRFGKLQEITRRGEVHGQWRAYREKEALERARDPTGDWGTGLFHQPRSSPAPKTAAERFSELRVGYALTSRITQGWEERPDILVCVQDDWAGYPRWVVEVADLRG